MPRSGPPGDPASPLRALLGPTNTGKTHRAIERMLEHDTGMLGLPLRLLAREVYDRVAARVGQAAVALVTGEERRIPAHPRYWVCTVESMPVHHTVDFLAVDEVQLSTHRQRGHVFTDRLLHARGVRETWFLGSGTMRALMARLCPTAVIESRPRLSTLGDAGSLSLRTLPPRSVLVAFSATRVYELAERLRAKRGGAAVVIGALSPRARNAQVALFQAGEVDTLVATDAIGMGLNLDVDNVVFADLRKFDGRTPRALEDAELAQIAGRAGRHHRDGQFATLEPLAPLPPATVRALEQHRFPEDERVFWRNHDLAFGSIEALTASLRERPFAPWLTPAIDAEDARALAALSRTDEVAALARGGERVRLLWAVCQIPDFRQLPFDDHFKLQAAVYAQLCGPRGRLARDFIDAQLLRLERTDGDLEALLDRMSAVRTWTYITAHAAWVEDAAGWQTRTHELEDRLSDALHQQLVQRFVDAPAMRGRRRAPAPAPEPRSLAGQLAARGLVSVIEDDRARPPADEAWVAALIEAPHERFAVDDEGRVLADGRPLGRLVRGADRLRPEVTLSIDVHGGARLQLGRRLLAFARDLVAALLAPLHAVPAAELGPAGRGLLYQLEQSLGSVRASGPDAELEAHERRVLLDHRIVLGRRAVFLPALLAPEPLRKRRALCAAELWPVGSPPASGAAAIPLHPAIPERIYEALGYLLAGELAVRADELEAIDHEIRRGVPAHVVAERLDIAPAHAAAVIATVRAARREKRRLA
jgi:ATP-dependent RNA helicase SUPV3L1/SUV3